MKLKLLLVFSFLFSTVISFSQNSQYLTPRNESCTSIMVGKKASTDGSVITSHTCDGRYRTWLNIVPAAKYEKDTTRKVYWGKLRTEFIADKVGVVEKGEIPQAKETYAFLNTAYPCMNEKQLAMGETTITGLEELHNENGLFLIEELQAIALERCTTARQAITLIGELVKKYGYGDSGECITIADTKEVWQLEIFGEGKKNIGGVWAAQRIPDDHVGISANYSRIGKLDLKNKDFFLASENVMEVAKEMKLWDGKKPFIFWKTYGDSKKPFGIREFFVLSSLNPSLNLDYNADEIPFSVKPENKVSVQDIMAFYRSTYEGTEYDMTRNLETPVREWNAESKKYEVVDTTISPAAHPWPTGSTRSLYNSLNDKTVEYQRTIAVSWCSYSEIIQLRDWLPNEVGGVAWFSFDNPGQSPRIPIFSGNLNLPDNFNICGQIKPQKPKKLILKTKSQVLCVINLLQNYE